jgi:hypothetical protein
MNETLAQIIYKSYVRWEESDKKDITLAANRLTNRQLYWVAYARFISAKYHPTVRQGVNASQRLFET